LDDFGDSSLNQWFGRYEADVVVVRPDRYVLGTGHNLDQITDAVRGLLAGEDRSAAAKREASKVRAL
jgi:hypothetical protein